MSEASTQDTTAATASTLPAPLQTLADKAPSLARVIQFGWRLGERWGLDKCGLIAASMAFYGLLSLFPVLLAGLAILGNRLAQNPNELEGFLSFVEKFFPGAAGELLTSRVQEQIQLLTQTPGGRTIGIISFLSLLWSGRAYFDTLASVLNSIWPKATPRTFIGHQIALWSTLIGAGMLFVLSTVITFGLELAQSLSTQVPRIGETLGESQTLWTVLGRGAGGALTLFMFWTVYRFLPNVKGEHRGRVALGSALVATICWELAKWAFPRFLSNTAHYGAIYGTFGGLVILMMWLYFSSTIVLLGAEVAAAYLETKAAARGEAKPTQDKPEDLAESLPESTKPKSEPQTENTP